LSTTEESAAFKPGNAVLLEQRAYNFVTDTQIPIVLVDKIEGEAEFVLDAKLANSKQCEFDSSISKLFDLHCRATSPQRKALSTPEICSLAEVALNDKTVRYC